jgi:hypothetical protein
MQEATMAL